MLRIMNVAYLYVCAIVIVMMHVAHKNRHTLDGGMLTVQWKYYVKSGERVREGIRHGRNDLISAPRMHFSTRIPKQMLCMD